MAEEGTITLSKDHIYGIVIVALVALLTISVFTSGFGIMPGKSTGISGQCGTGGSGSGSNSTGETGASLKTLTVTTGTNPVRGQSSAPVTIIEFSDYQCPYCGRLYTNVDTKLETNYIDTGKVKMYFRDVPLSFHDKSKLAAEAARCAGAQNKYWEMHDKLFSSQSSWSSLSASDFPATAAGYASDLGLDATKFSSCLSASTYASEISTDSDYAGSLDIDNGAGYPSGITGTPGVIIQLPKSKTSYSSLKSVVDSQNSQGGNLQVYQDSDNYVVFVPGAYPYSTFAAVLNTVTY